MTAGACRALLVAGLVACAPDAAPPGAPSPVTSSPATAASASSATPEVHTTVDGVLIAPTLARAELARGIPITAKRATGNPQILWGRRPVEHHCMLDVDGRRARCAAITEAVTRHGDVFGPVPTERPDRALLYVPADDANGTTDIAIRDLSGKRVVPTSLGIAYLGASGALWGLEGDRALHRFEKLDGGSTRWPLERQMTTQLAGDQVVMIADGSGKLSARRLRGAVLEDAHELGVAPSLLTAQPCQREAGSGGLLLLPSFGDSPRIVQGYVLEAGQWQPERTVAVDGPFDEGTVVSCSKGALWATELVADGVRVASCDKTRCDFTRVAAEVGYGSAGTVAGRIILADRAEGTTKVRVRSGSPSALAKAPEQPIACAEDKPSAKGTIDVLPAIGGAYVILGGRENATLCAFFVRADGDIVPVQPAEG